VSNTSASALDPTTDNRPLSDREVELVQRLLSDPLSLPMTFKSWLVSYLEISDIALPMANVLGLTTTLGLDAGSTGTVSLLNTGTIILYAGTDTPTDALACNGGAYDTSVHPELFNVLGYRFGGSGNTFNVPNLAAPDPNTKYLIVS
jgi:Phage Tail Collar Domain